MIDQSDRTPTASRGSVSNGARTARIGIQSADRLRRETLAAYLETLPHFTVVGRVARYDDVVSLLSVEHAGIVLLDAGRDARRVRRVAGAVLRAAHVMHGLTAAR